MSSLSKIFSMTYTKFQVSDGISFSQRFRKYYHWIELIKTFSMIYIMSSLSEKFSLTYTMFEVSDVNSFN